MWAEKVFCWQNKLAYNLIELTDSKAKAELENDSWV